VSDLPPRVHGPFDARAAGESTAPAKPRKPRRRALIEWSAIIVIAVLVSFLMRTYAFQTFYIPSGSMEPTLQIGDRIVVNKLAVTFGTINVGDIVVFKAPPPKTVASR